MSLIAPYNIQLGPQSLTTGVSLQSAHYYLAPASPSVLFISLPRPLLCLRPWAGTVPRVLIGKWYDCNPASDPPFFRQWVSAAARSWWDNCSGDSHDHDRFVPASLVCLNGSEKVYSHFLWFSRMRRRWGEAATVCQTACCVLDGIHGVRLCDSFNTTKPVY